MFFQSINRLPENVSYGEGALIEPMAVGVYACQKFNLNKDPDKSVLVTGAGPVGLLTAGVAKAYGVKNICIIGITTSQLNDPFPLIPLDLL